MSPETGQIPPSAPGGLDTQYGALRYPYPGLRTFDRNEARIFFGRRQHENEILDRLATSHFVAVVGTSGCGKSSLIRAGVIPALESGRFYQAGTHWRTIIFRPGSAPLWRLAEAMLAEFASQPEPRGDQILEASVLLSSGLEGIRDFLEEHNFPEHHNLLIVVDQFEELFRYEQSSAEEEAKDFVEVLLTVFAGKLQNVYVIITMRTDHFGDCTRFEGLADAINTSFYLTPRLNDEERRQAIENPARIFGARLEPRLRERILRDMGSNPDQLPLMQHVMMRMWQAAKNEAQAGAEITLSLKLYESFGGLQHALEAHAGEIMADIKRRWGRDAVEVAEILFRQLTLRQEGAEIQDVRRPTAFHIIADIVAARKPSARDCLQDIADIFRDPDMAFLSPLQPNPIRDDTILDIVHESILRQWSDLKRWVAQENQCVRRLHELLRSAEDEQRLLDKVNTQILSKWWNEEQPSKSWAERYGVPAQQLELIRDYLNRSIAWQEKLKKDEQKAQELEQEKRIQQIRKRAGITLIVVVSIFIAVGTIFVMEAREEARENERLLQEQVQHRKALITDLRYAATLAREREFRSLQKFIDLRLDLDIKKAEKFFKRNNIKTNENALAVASAREARHLLGVYLDFNRVYDESPDNDKQTVAMAVADRLNERDIEISFTADANDENILYAILDSAGKVMLVGERGHTVNEWQVTAGTRGDKRGTPRAWLELDDKMLYTVGPNRALRAWSIPSGTLAKEIVTPQDEVLAAEISRDRKNAVVLLRRPVSNEGQRSSALGYIAQVISLPLALRVRTFTLELEDVDFTPEDADNFYVRDFAIGGPEGRTVAVAFGNKATAVWRLNTDSDNVKPSFYFHFAPIPFPTIAISPDGKWMALGESNKVLLWPLDEQTPHRVTDKPFRSFTDEETNIVDVKFMSDGHLVSVSRDGDIRDYRFEHGYSHRRLLATDRLFSAGHFATYGSTLAAIYAEGKLRTWNLQVQQENSDTVIRALGQMPVKTVVVPGLDAIALALADGSVELYEPKRDKTQLVYDPKSSTPDSPKIPTTAIAASENGRFIAIGKLDGSLAILEFKQGSAGEPQVKRIEELSLSELLSSPTSGKKSKYRIDSLVFGPESAQLVIGGHRNWLVALNRKEGSWQSRTLLEPDEPEDTICALAFDAKGSTLVSGGTNGQVQVWDTKKWNGETLFSPVSGSVLSLDVNAEGTRIAAIVTDGHVAECSDEEHFLKTHFGRLKLTDRRGSPVGEWSDEAQKRMELTTFVEFTPSGNQLIAANGLGNISVFDLSSSELLIELEAANFVAWDEKKYYKTYGIDFGCISDGHCWLSVPVQHENKWIMFDLGRISTASDS